MSTTALNRMSRRATGRRAVITGIGVVAPGKPGREPFWEMISAGHTATGPVSFFDASAFRSRIAAECDFDPAAGLSPQKARRMDRTSQLAVTAAREAVLDSGLGPDVCDPHRIGVSIGSAVGCTMGLEEEYVVTSDGGRKWTVDHEYAVPHLFNHFIPSSISTEVAWEVGAEGPTALISTGCTSGLDAVGHARELIEEGSADVVVAGGADAPISPITLACFDAIRATSNRNNDPGSASRPFDKTRNGFVLAEGSAVFVVEELESARKRGVHVYGEVAGFSTRCNAYHMTGLSSDGIEMAEAIRSAMAEARIGPSEVDYVNAHGSGTVQNDRHETQAFKETLGEYAYRTPVSSIKSMVGHSLGAIGSIEIAACLLAMRDSLLPPTANLHDPDPALDLDYIPLKARETKAETVLTVGSGFGGFQSAMVLTSMLGEAA